MATGTRSRIRTISCRVGLFPGLAVLAALYAFPALQARDSSGFVVIVNATNQTKSLTAKQVSDLFIRRTSTWPDGAKAEPVDLPAKSTVREDFSRAIHRKSVTAIKIFWAESLFEGRARAPKELKSEADVVAYVATKPGAIGYVSPSARIGAAKIVDVQD